MHPNFQLTTVESVKVNVMPIYVVDRYIQVFHGISYHLNPDVVHDTEVIPFCLKCSNVPRTSEFSIASGHDYGRPGDLSELNDVASKCIAPVRSFGLAPASILSDTRNVLLAL